MQRPSLSRLLQEYVYTVQFVLRWVWALLSVSLTERYAAATRHVPARLPLPRVTRRPDPVTAATAPPGLLTQDDFAPVNEPGFGDHWNTFPWSMLWWRDQLYVGTNRAFPCVEYYHFHTYFPFLQRYPPRFDPDVTCPDCIYDLPFQAEIWRYTTPTATWERVYQSPGDVAAPGQPDKLLARDIGFRNMALFDDPDGTEALYVAGVSARAINRVAPPPRLLRSTDGVSFDPVPAEPGTTLGRLDAIGFRGLVRFDERLFVAAGGLHGAGPVYETRNPAGGNDCFQLAIPAEIRANDMAVFADHLYLGLRHPVKGYGVVKTKAAGTPPYHFETVIPFGAYRGGAVCNHVIAMHVFNGALYVGTNAPTELIRIYPDDSWDLVMGKPRRTPQGMKYPLSGMGDGFDDTMNRCINRMQEHDGWLYVGTFNGAGKQLALPVFGPWVRPRMGFDLFATRDGIHFFTVTRSGFGDYGNTARTFASTPAGLFLGAVDERYGARVYLARSDASRREGAR